MHHSSTNSKTNPPFFQFPLNFEKSLILTLLLFISGFIAQWLHGNKLIYPPSWPGNAYIIIFFWLIAILSTLNLKNSFINWLSAREASISAMILFFVVILMSGIFKQEHQESYKLVEKLGLTHVIHSWHFIIACSYLLIVNGFVIAKRLTTLNIKNIAFALTLGGFWFVLAIAILGSGDLYKLKMTLYKGEKTNYAFDSRNHSYKMPFSVELKGFKIEEYPPSLNIITRNENIINHETQSDVKELCLGADYILEGWEIKVMKYYTLSIKTFNGDYLPDSSFGSVPSAFIIAKKINTKETKQGWISSGNTLNPREILQLDRQYSISMNYPRPKKISSVLIIYLTDTSLKSITVATSKPIKVGKWKIYQSGFDESMGKWSDYSIIETVLDPWLKIIYCGIIIMLAGIMIILFLRLREIKIIRSLNKKYLHAFDTD